MMLMLLGILLMPLAVPVKSSICNKLLQPTDCKGESYHTAQRQDAMACLILLSVRGVDRMALRKLVVPK